MPANLLHIRHQGPVIRALGRAAFGAVRERLGRGGDSVSAVPGTVHEAVVAPRPAALVTDYIRAVGGDPRTYRGTLPPHFFPQFAFPILSQALDGCGYPLARGMNFGSELTRRAALPVGEPLQLRAQLTKVDDNGHRAILTQTLTVSTKSSPDALQAKVFVYVPLPSKEKRNGAKPKRQRPRVPQDAREIAFWRLTPRHALDFAILTGDFNPIHWIPLAARAAGFKSTILHGFATLARAIEGLTQALWAGDPTRLEHISVRFTRPLVLPARVGLYVDHQGGVSVGDAPGGPAYLVGTYREATDP